MERAEDLRSAGNNPSIRVRYTKGIKAVTPSKHINEHL
jgi:hypothetical protein